jgi:hypothetical protein
MIRDLCRQVLVLLGLLVIAASSVQAQRAVVASVGARIRIQLPTDTAWRAGRLVGAVPDTLRLQSCDTCSVVPYARSNIAAVEVRVTRRGRGSTTLKGTYLGMAVGLGAGLLYGWQKTRGPDCEYVCGLAYVAVPVLGFGGLVVGTAVGASIKSVEWQPALIR